MSDFTYGLTVNSTIGIAGTISADSAQAGSIGEFVQGQLLQASPTALTTNTAANIISISLTAGDWDVTGFADFLPAATTSVTLMTYGVSTVSATIGIQDTYGQVAQGAQVPGANISAFDTPTIRINISTTTTVYLVVKSVFTVSTMAAFGTLRARRVR